MSHPVPLRDVVAFMDRMLALPDVPDEARALNGLQVENQGVVTWLGAAVDASLAIIAKLVDPSLAHDQPGPGLLVVHHGLFWDGLQPLTGRHYQRVRRLLDRDIALYSAHIPLDVHPEVGNNAILAQRLGLQDQGTFGSYQGTPLGVWGFAPPHLSTHRALRSALAAALEISVEQVKLIPGGPIAISRVGIITGAGGNMVRAARDAGLDTYVTGEGPHHSHIDAMEFGVNLVLAGHYATETLGVQAIAERVASQFGLPWKFHDHPSGP